MLADRLKHFGFLFLLAALLQIIFFTHSEINAQGLTQPQKALTANQIIQRINDASYDKKASLCNDIKSSLATYPYDSSNPNAGFIKIGNEYHYTNIYQIFLISFSCNDGVIRLFPLDSWLNKEDIKIDCNLYKFNTWLDISKLISMTDFHSSIIKCSKIGKIELKDKKINSINISNSIIEKFQFETVHIDDILLNNSHILKHSNFSSLDVKIDFYAVGTRWNGLSLAGSNIGGLFKLESGEFSPADINETILLDPYCLSSTFSLCDAKIGNFDLSKATVKGNFFADRVKVGGYLFLGRTIVQGFASFANATIGGWINGVRSEWHTGVSFNGVRIAEGDLDLTSMIVKCSEPQHGDKDQIPCNVRRGLDIRSLSARHLIMRNATIETTVDGHEMLLKGFLNISNSTVAGALNFQDSDVGAGFVAENARVHSEINLNSLTTGRGITFDGATINGDIYLRSAKVGGHVSFNNAQLLHDVDLGYAQIGQSLYGENIENWNGRLRLSAATIKDGIYFDKVKIWTGNIHSPDARISKSAILKNIHFEKPAICSAQNPECLNLNFASAHIDGDLDLTNTELASGARFSQARIMGDVILAGTLIKAPMNLNQASFVTLRTFPEVLPNETPKPLSEKALQPAEPPKPVIPATLNQLPKDGHLAIAKGGEIKLLGAKFSAPLISLEAATLYDAETGKRAFVPAPDKKGDQRIFAPIRMAGAEYGLRAVTDSKEKLLWQDPSDMVAWLESEAAAKDPRDPQAHEQLAKALTDIGREDDGEEILKAKFDRRLSAKELPLEQWVLLKISGIITNYGLNNVKAFFFWAGLVFFGMFVRAGLFRRLPERLFKKGYKLNALSAPQGKLNIWNHSFWYSLSAAIPIVPDLYPPKPFHRVKNRQEDAGPMLGPCKAEGYFILHRILAFGLVSLVIAGMAGLIK